MIKKRIINICVIDDDIRYGSPKNPVSCPIARAIHRTLALPVRVHDDYVEIWNLAPGSKTEVDLPLDAQSFIGAFDDGEKVTPLEFEIKIVENRL